MISPTAIRIFYYDSTCSLNENLLAIRFPDFKSRIFFIDSIHCPNSVPEISKNEQALTLLMIDNAKIDRKTPFDNIDIEIALISRED